MEDFNSDIARDIRVELFYSYIISKNDVSQDDEQLLLKEKNIIFYNRRERIYKETGKKCVSIVNIWNHMITKYRSTKTYKLASLNIGDNLRGKLDKIISW